jgi:signal transduction histidine kinase
VGVLVVVSTAVLTEKERAWLGVVAVSLAATIAAADSERALQASQHLSSSQARALRGTLEALATEPSPARCLAHILRTTRDQFGAHSISVWGKDPSSNLIGLEYAFEDGELVTRAAPRFSGLPRWLPMENIWPWPAVFRTGEASIIEDIRDVPPFPLRDRLLPMGVITVLLVPMSIAGKLEGAVGLRFVQKRAFRPEETELAQALANYAMLMIQFERLSAQSRESAIVAERNRMARDMHDTLAQGFTGVIAQLGASEDALARGLEAEAGEHVGRALNLARESLNEARRSVRALRPQALAAGNLGDSLAGLFARLTHGTAARADFGVVNEPRALPPDGEEHLFRIGQEILTNALRHARATCFRARLTFTDDDVRLDMHDDGVGFDVSAPTDGHGLAGVNERVVAMGGTVTVRSGPGEGTTVVVTVPVARPFEVSERLP